VIELYYWTTPNGHKITIFLEEAGLPYRMVPVNISRGEQFKPEFLRISPNNRIPAIVDDAPATGGRPVSARSNRERSSNISQRRPANSCRKTCTAASRSCSGCSGRWAGSARWRDRTTISANTPRKKISYAIERYAKETNRLYGVLDKRLADREFVAGDCSIADMASYPWIVPYERQGQKLDDFPNVKRWFETIRARPAIMRAYELAKKINVQPTVSEESKSVLFGQTAATAAR
jgi:GSH-dependent disulfide-bond oxidoreductase